MHRLPTAAAAELLQLGGCGKPFGRLCTILQAFGDLGVFWKICVGLLRAFSNVSGHCSAVHLYFWPGQILRFYSRLVSQYELGIDV